MYVSAASMLRKHDFEHGDIIVHYAKKFHINGMDYNDLIQEGAVGYLKAVENFRDGKGSLRGFIGLCIKRHLSTTLEKSLREKRKLNIEALSLEKIVTEEEDLYDFISNDTDVEGDFMKKEKIKEAYKVIERDFSDLEKNSFLLFLKGYSYDEIAEEIGTHYKSVDNAIVRARRKINEDSN